MRIPSHVSPSARVQARDLVGRWAPEVRTEASLRLVPAPSHALAVSPARDLALGYLTVRRGLDQAQAAAIWNRLIAEARPAAEIGSNFWSGFVSHCEARANKMAARGNHVWAQAYRAMASRPVDPVAAQALLGLPKAGHYAEEHLAAQVRGVAAFTGAAEPVVRRRIDALRAQYATDLAHLDPAVRPDPPEMWVRGFTAKDATAKGCPPDPATLYAFYRAQADERAFTSAERGNPTYASTDLETASPDGPSGFQPRNGHIIEVGIVVYDDAGREVDRYERLIRPPQTALDTYGTGRVDIHHITVADLDGHPGWSECAADVRAALANHTLLAQGSRFERSWLGHHLTSAGQDWDRDCRGVDTLTIAHQHFPDLEKHRLAYICAAVGVPYTHGHRAMHDAVAAGRAFFAMRARIRQRYVSDPRFAGLPRPR